jgi:hypothetical protein
MIAMLVVIDGLSVGAKTSAICAVAAVGARVHGELLKEAMGS